LSTQTVAGRKLRRETGRGFSSPWSSCGLATGFDSAEPRCRKYTDTHTIAAIDRNSLCQF
jgi:hypothetical protein